MRKNTSHLVKNIPVSSSTKKDCASGSYQPTSLSSNGPLVTLTEVISLPRVLLTFLSWNSALCCSLAFLTEIIVSWTVSKVPAAVYVSDAVVEESSKLLSLLLVKVKRLLPVSNLGKLTPFGFGIN